MSSHDPLPEEMELQALFDATAEEPSADQLHRLARHAAQIPEHATVSPVKRWLRRLVPALALAATATAGWWLMAKPDADPGPSPIGTRPAIAMTGDDGDSIRPDSSVIPLLDEEQEAMALAVLDGDFDDDDDDEALGGSLDDPLASLDVAGGGISHPLDGAELLFGDDDDLLDLDAVFDEEGG